MTVSSTFNHQHGLALPRTLTDLTAYFCLGTRLCVSLYLSTVINFLILFFPFFPSASLYHTVRVNP